MLICKFSLFELSFAWTNEWLIISSELTKILLHLLFKFENVFRFEPITCKSNLIEFCPFAIFAPVFDKLINMYFIIAPNSEFFQISFEVWQFKQIRNHCFKYRWFCLIYVKYQLFNIKLWDFIKSGTKFFRVFYRR